MRRAFKPRNSGPMDKFIMKTPDKKTRGNEPRLSKLQQDETKLEPRENEPHDTHSFEWQWNQKNPTTLTCNTPGTIEDALKKSSQFRAIANENKDKELVILKGGKAISSHFPCCLIIRGERLIIKFVKRDCKLQKVAPRPQKRVRPEELVTFHVLTQGGKKITKIMTNPVLKTSLPEITVYAYKGEKVKQALKRDGRLKKIIFGKNCALSDKSTEVNTEMSSLVDDLEGKTFQIVLLDGSPPQSPPGSLDDADLSQKQSDASEDPPGPASPAPSVSENPSENKPNRATAEAFREIPDSKKMQVQLFKQFREGVKLVKSPNVSKRTAFQNLLNVEFGKSKRACSENKTMKTLMKLGDSVCQVRIKGGPAGSGFLLFDKFVLTNAHVVREIYDESMGHLRETVTVHFSFESLEGEQQPGMEVEEIVGYGYCHDPSGNKCDWALLKLRPGLTLPECLLKHFNFLPPHGGICIIGHPDGGVKSHDTCFIIPSNEHRHIVEKHSRENPDGVLPENNDYSGGNTRIQLVTDNFFNDVENSLRQNIRSLNYESCFYFGSSGSPVFDKHCNVVAMHSGGYAYNNSAGQLQSVIEYGHPLSDIMEQMIIQIVERGKWDVLKEYLTFNDAKQTHVIGNVKKLFQSRNLTAFREAVNNPAVASDEKCKAFFDFICQSEEPVAMDTD